MSSHSDLTDRPYVPLLLGRFRDARLANAVILDVKANKWRELSLPLPYSSWMHGAALLNGEVYFFGGDQGGRAAYKLNGNWEWERLADMNDERRGISNSSVVLNELLWVVGGSNSQKKPLKSVEAYDPKSNSWIPKPEMNISREWAAAAVAGDRIFVCGGFCPDADSSVEVFDPQLSRWTFFAPLPAPRYGLGAVVVADSFLTLMGGADTYHRETDTAWTINLDDPDAKWQQLPRMREPRAVCCAYSLGGKITVAGGWNEGGPTSTEFFDGGEWASGPALPGNLKLGYMATVVVFQEMADSLLGRFKKF